MNNYYAKNLFSDRLEKCYSIASPRIQQYLDAEIDYVLSKVKPGAGVLELGCGYGRAMEQLLEKTKNVIGIDSSPNSIAHAKKYLKDKSGWQVQLMDAIDLRFDDAYFDVVVCIQNGLSAFHENPVRIMSEALRVTRRGGLALFSTYAEQFWNERLKWFRDQAAHGLVGEIDEEKTGNGMIVCKDGFTARTFSKGDFHQCANIVEMDINLIEIDKSVLFCEIYKN